MESANTKEIVITGGPCAGKSQGIRYVVAELRRRGIRVFVVNEIPTEFILSRGLDLPELFGADPEKYYALEREILLAYLFRREKYRARTRIFSEKPYVILFDRGPMDIAAYVTSECFENILYDERLTYFEVRDSFDAVIHLVTAAYGAESFYTTENNEARSETPAEARVKDAKTLNSWLGHPHLRIIDNSTDFDGKKKRLFRAVWKALGTPVPTEIERRFLLKELPDFRIPILRDASHFRVEQMYLVLPGGESVRIRKRTQGHYSHYTKTRKSPYSERSRLEEEEAIGAMDYFNLRAFKDPNRAVIRKHRTYFVYNNQYFELDIFREPAAGLGILEIELISEDAEVELPPFISVECEVTGDPFYSNYEIAGRP